MLKGFERQPSRLEFGHTGRNAVRLLAREGISKVHI
jgi:hypothetical protein